MRTKKHILTEAQYHALQAAMIELERRGLQNQLDELINASKLTIDAVTECLIAAGVPELKITLTLLKDVTARVEKKVA